MSDLLSKPDDADSDPVDMGIRGKARRILDEALPWGKVITSDGATADEFKRMTGVSQDALDANWKKGGHLTCCNGFTGWYGAKLGAKKYMGVFDLKHLAETSGGKGSWIASTKSNRPRYGDILRHASFHVDVCVGFDGGCLRRAAGGQGGPVAHHDVIQRVASAAPYDWTKLVGWIDIEAYFGQPAIDDPAFLGWYWRNN